MARPPSRPAGRAGAPRARGGAGRAASSQGAGPAEPPPPYAALSQPVYSLVTVPAADAPQGRPTVNLVTYAAPVALEPVRKFAVGLYQGTLSRENLLGAGRQGVLQILCEGHRPLLELLGRTSGRDVDKFTKIERAGFRLVERFDGGYPTLEDCAGSMLVEVASEPIPCGDHDVVILDVLDHDPGAAQSDPLYTAKLREWGFL